MTDKSDLTRIEGIGETRAKALNNVGINTFEDITKLSDAQLADLDENLSLRGAADTHNWRGKAAELIEADKKAPPAGDDEKKTEVGNTKPKAAAKPKAAPKAPTSAPKASLPSTATPDEQKELDKQHNTDEETHPDDNVTSGPLDGVYEDDGTPIATGQAPLGAVASSPNPNEDLGLTPRHNPSPDQLVENVLRGAQEEARQGRQANAKGLRLDRNRPFGEVHGYVEGYGAAISFEQDGRFFDVNEVEVKQK